MGKRGFTNNPNGRPPGIPNQSTTETKEILNNILKKNFTPAKVQRDLNALTPDRRLEILTKLLRPTETNLKLNTPGEDDFSGIQIEIIDRRDQVDPEYLKGQ